MVIYVKINEVFAATGQNT